jgi:hypothetical protein
LGEAVHADDGAFVQAAGDEFAFVTRGDLKRHFADGFSFRQQISDHGAFLLQFVDGCGRLRKTFEFAATAESRDEIDERFKSHTRARLAQNGATGNATWQNQLTFF